MLLSTISHDIIRMLMEYETKAILLMNNDIIEISEGALQLIGHTPLPSPPNKSLLNSFSLNQKHWKQNSKEAFITKIG